MKTASLSLAALAATTSAFIIPSTVSAPELSVTSDDRIVIDTSDGRLDRSSFEVIELDLKKLESDSDDGSLLEDLIKAIEAEAVADPFKATSPRPDVFRHHDEDDDEDDDEEKHRHHHDHDHPQPHHIWAGPPPPLPMDCAAESNIFSKTLCSTRNMLTSLTTSFSSPPHSPRRGGCHRRPPPDSQTPDARPWPAGLIPPPHFPEGFPKPKGGPLKFWPRPDGPGDREDFRPPPGAGHPAEDVDGEATAVDFENEAAACAREGLHGRPCPHHGHGHGHREHEHEHHHHHHEGPLGGVFKFLYVLTFGVLVPIIIGVVAGLVASVLGMMVGSAVAWVWVRLVRGGRRGHVSRAVVVEDGLVQSEKVGLMEDEVVDEEALPVYVEAPVYVEKA